MGKQKREHFAFLDGYKPALLISPRNPFFETVLATDFPSITPFDDEPGSYIFFQTEKQKEEYQRKIEGVALRSYDFHMIVGETLGFPMRSVKYYAEMRGLEDKLGHYPEIERQEKIGVNWAGFFFSSHIDFVVEEVQWLFNTYQHEKAVGLPLCLSRLAEGLGSVDIPYGDITKLCAVVREIQEERKQKATTIA
ncbi:hypothetical protein MK805_04565 [Shimazuella sp. AN120528]|uniref:hypothetical protein n=1 Tax=Shimazuella soli TaxID=1892854 RepID=UPI001F1111BF|nr:hypothetical protein [Shimazuella soli]MCH5584240.1 hypothetical protein [Shimazuella soli]